MRGQLAACCRVKWALLGAAIWKQAPIPSSFRGPSSFMEELALFHGISRV